MKKERKRKGPPLRLRLEEALHFRLKTVDELAREPAFSDTTASSIRATLYRHRPDFDRELETGRWWHTRGGGWTPWTDKDRPVRADHLTDLKCWECEGTRFLVRLAERSEYTPYGEQFELCCASCHEVYEFSRDDDEASYRVAVRDDVGVAMYRVRVSALVDKLCAIAATLEGKPRAEFRLDRQLIYERRWDEPEDDYDTVWAAKKAKLAEAEEKEEHNRLAESVGLESPFPCAPVEEDSDGPFTERSTEPFGSTLRTARASALGRKFECIDGPLDRPGKFLRHVLRNGEHDVQWLHESANYLGFTREQLRGAYDALVGRGEGSFDGYSEHNLWTWALREGVKPCRCVKSRDSVREDSPDSFSE